jgi:hypothetical protein
MRTYAPTGLGCVVEVRNDLTGDEIELTDHERGRWPLPGKA